MLCEALEEIVGGPLFRHDGYTLKIKVNPITLAKRLEAYRDRPALGFCLEKRPRNQRGVRWRVVPVPAAGGGTAARAAAAESPLRHSAEGANSSTNENNNQLKIPENSNSISTNSIDDEEFRP